MILKGGIDYSFCEKLRFTVDFASTPYIVNCEFSEFFGAEPLVVWSVEINDSAKSELQKLLQSSKFNVFEEPRGAVLDGNSYELAVCSWRYNTLIRWNDNPPGSWKALVNWFDELVKLLIKDKELKIVV